MSLVVANEIANQIGNRAFVMMGATNKMGWENGLQWKIGRNAKKVTHVVVTLQDNDTYTVKFQRVGRSYNVSTTAEVSNVYADQLHAVITEHTGLCLSL